MSENLFTSTVLAQVDAICDELRSLPDEPRIEMLNRIRERLHQISPFKGEPVDLVLWVIADRVQGNDYNPNTVAPPEMRLLERSIEADGFTQPIVADEDRRDDRDFTVVDGFHRNRVGKESKRVRKRLKGYLPITLISSDRRGMKERIAATIRHNQARGVHGVVPMTTVVEMMLREGCTDAEVCKELGMGADELLRFKQRCGLPDLFRDREYSRSWVSGEGQGEKDA